MLCLLRRAGNPKAARVITSSRTLAYFFVSPTGCASEPKAGPLLTLVEYIFWFSLILSLGSVTRRWLRKWTKRAQLWKFCVFSKHPKKSRLNKTWPRGKTIQWFPAKLETVTFLGDRLICFSVADPNVCSDFQLLQFPNRYLEWIMVAREHSIDPAFNLDFDARADALTEDERRDVLSVRTWFLCSRDLRRHATFLTESVTWWHHLWGEALNPGVLFSSEWTAKNIKGPGTGW